MQDRGGVEGAEGGCPRTVSPEKPSGSAPPSAGARTRTPSPWLPVLHELW